MKCKTCRYWEANNNTRRGKCRAKAPLGGTSLEYLGSAINWPVTNDFDWCGDWKDKNE